jgi:hypothetical protein
MGNKTHRNLQAKGEKLLAAPLIMFAYLLLLVIVS